MRRRNFCIGFSAFVYSLLNAEDRKFSDLNDSEKKEVLFGIVKEMDGKYTFPVPMASEIARGEALGVDKTSYEFGAGRKGYKGYKHKGIDIYGFDKDIVYFADGKIAAVGRHKQINKFDYGNIIIVEHGKIRGYDLLSCYLHMGALDGVEEGDIVKMGEPFAKIDCTGITYERYNTKKKKKIKILYPPGSRDCKKFAHLHFQIRIGDMYVNPNYFFPEYSEKSLPELKRWRLAIKASSLDGKIINFRRRENLGSFSF